MNDLDIISFHAALVYIQVSLSLINHYYERVRRHSPINILVTLLYPAPTELGGGGGGGGGGVGGQQFLLW